MCKKRSNGTRQKYRAKIERGMLKIRQNSLARAGAQIGGGQGEVQGRLVAIYLSAKTVTLPLLLRIGLHPWHRIINCNCPLAIGLRIVTAPLQSFPQCKGLRREPTRKAFEAGESSYFSWAGTSGTGVSVLRSRLRERLT